MATLDGSQVRTGDLVRLRMGSQTMTVVSFDGDGADCVWRNGSQEQTAWVSFACLVKAPAHRWPWQAKATALAKRTA